MEKIFAIALWPSTASSLPRKPERVQFMPSNIAAIAEQYFETIDATSLSMLADPLDAEHYTQLALGIRDRAFALAHEAAMLKPENADDTWLQIRIFATLPALLESVPPDLVKIRSRILNNYVKCQEEFVTATYEQQPLSPKHDRTITAVMKRDLLHEITIKSRLAVAVAARGDTESPELIKRLLDVADHAEMLSLK